MIATVTPRRARDRARLRIRLALGELEALSTPESHGALVRAHRALDELAQLEAPEPGPRTRAGDGKRPRLGAVLADARARIEPALARRGIRWQISIADATCAELPMDSPDRFVEAVYRALARTLAAERSTSAIETSVDAGRRGIDVCFRIAGDETPIAALTWPREPREPREP